MVTESDPRYHLIDMLRQDELGIVYRAYDRLKDQRIALKRITAPIDDLIFDGRPENPAAPEMEIRLALVQTFARLAQLRHRHLISILDYGFDAAGQFYFVMPLIGAQAAVFNHQPLPFNVKINVITDILDGLATLHRNGLLHYSLKPEHILISGGRVKLADYGLSLVMRSDMQPDPNGSLATALALMAPELLRGINASEASDLYAVGVIAYIMFTGRHPYPSANPDGSEEALGLPKLITGILYEHADMKALVQAIARSGSDEQRWRLVEVIRRLLEKSPDDRFQHAEDALIALTPGADRHREFHGKPRAPRHMVGRDAELRSLLDALSKAQSGSGSLWAVVGSRGIGKTRLVEEVCQYAKTANMVNVSGAAQPHGDQPYAAWRSGLRWLAMHAGSRLSDDDAVPLLALIPDLAEIIGRDLPPSTLARCGETARLASAAAGLIRAAGRPVLIVIEDLHRGDDDLGLVEALIERVADLPVLLVITLRDNATTTRRLASLDKVIRLNRLDQPSIGALSEQMLGAGGSNPALIERLDQQGEGNPLVTIEMIRALTAQAGEGMRIEGETLAAVRLPRGIEGLIRRRLEAAPAWTRDLVNVAATAGNVLDFALLNWVNPTVNLDQWVMACAEADLLTIREQRWVFEHELVREVVLDQIPPRVKRELHTQIAQGLRALYDLSPAVLPALAYHWGEAGDFVREAEAAAWAGEAAFKSYAVGEARRLTTRALEIAMIGRLDPGTVVQCHLTMAMLLLTQGKLEAAAAHHRAGFEGARQLGDPVLIARSLLAAACLKMIHDDLFSAAQLLGFVRHHWVLGSEVDPIGLRIGLLIHLENSPLDFSLDQAMAAGGALSLDDAIEITGI